MTPAQFAYQRAESLPHLLEMLKRSPGDSKILAGGQSLIPLMNARLARPQFLIDIWRVDEIRGVDVGTETISIGAATRHEEVLRNPSLRELVPIVPQVVSQIGHLPIRTRGTVGGSVAHADPTAEWCLLAVGLDAGVEVASASGTRMVPADEFLVGFYGTVLADDECITRVVMPTPPRTSGFAEFSRRRGDFALASALATVSDDDGAGARTRVAVAGGGARPVVIPAVGEALAGALGDPGALDLVPDLLADALDPVEDIQGSADYRRHLCGIVARQAIERAWARYGAGGT